MNFNLVVITCFLLVLGIANVSAVNKKICILYKNVNNPDLILMKVLIVQGSENFVGLGPDHIIDTNWSYITTRINVEEDEDILITDMTKLSNTTITVIIFVAEITDAEAKQIRQDQVPEIIHRRLFRACSEMPTVVKGGTRGDFTRVIKLTVYDRVVFFVPVNAKNEKIELDREYGVAMFLEHAGEFYPNVEAKEIKHKNNIVVRASEGFNYAEHCKPQQTIALKYDKGNTGKPEFEGDWEYHTLGTEGETSVFKITRVL